MIWSDQWWSQLRYNHAEFEARCKAARLPAIVGWINNKPRFAGAVDMERVQELVAGQPSQAMATPTQKKVVAPKARPVPVHKKSKDK